MFVDFFGPRFSESLGVFRRRIPGKSFEKDGRVHNPCVAMYYWGRSRLGLEGYGAIELSCFWCAVGGLGGLFEFGRRESKNPLMLIVIITIAVGAIGGSWRLYEPWRKGQSCFVLVIVLSGPRGRKSGDGFDA